MCSSKNLINDPAFLLLYSPTTSFFSQDCSSCVPKMTAIVLDVTLQFSTVRMETHCFSQVSFVLCEKKKKIPQEPETVLDRKKVTTTYINEIQFVILCVSINVNKSQPRLREVGLFLDARPLKSGEFFKLRNFEVC